MSKKAAFTLIELLVVISIILIASSIIFIGGTGGDGAKLSSAQRIVSGIAQGARGQAILKNANTRLIIYSDSASNLDDEKKLRYFGIIYEATDTPAGDDWLAATQVTNYMWRLNASRCQVLSRLTLNNLCILLY